MSVQFGAGAWVGAGDLDQQERGLGSGRDHGELLRRDTAREGFAPGPFDDDLIRGLVDLP
jgi:hypothetical protein